MISLLHPQSVILRRVITNHTLKLHALTPRNLLSKANQRSFGPSRRHRSDGRKHSSRSNNSNNPLPPYVTYGFILPTAGLTVASVYAYYSCLDFVPFTHRRRFLATSQAWEAHKGHQQYKALLQQHKNDILPENHRASVTVRRVGSRIAKSAEEFMKRCDAERGTHSDNQHLSDSPYTYTVIRSDEANAFVLPGNHVFVLTGLFRYCHNEDELASILGHEMAHNIARHAGERISDSLVMTMLSRLTLLIDPSGFLFSIFVPAQTLLYSLPHSREHEVEADKIGLVLASEACYDPRSAKKVFSRMKDDTERGSGRSNAPPPEFISTHPGYDTRLNHFDEWMPDAMERFNEDGGMKCRNIRDEMTRARRLAAAKADLNQ